MREPVTTCVSAIVPPTRAERARAGAEGGSAAAHDTFLADWPALRTVECRQPAVPAPPGWPLTVAGWNIERCKHVEASAELLARAGADIVLATEMDCGMARSGQRHTTADLAGALGMGHAFGVEFVELGLGDPRETAEFAGESNRHGLHGNAVLSRLPIARAALLPLDDGGAWFVRAPKGDGQHRVGGRMALAVSIEMPGGPVCFAAAHFESESTPDSRAEEARRLVAGIAAVFGPGPAVIGGDLNTARFVDGAADPADWLDRPEASEPAFTVFRNAGFDWLAANTAAITTRAHPWHGPDWRGKKLDWLLTRGLAAHAPGVPAAIDGTGRVLSDHDPVLASVAPA